jgi:hypothetical protein
MKSTSTLRAASGRAQNQAVPPPHHTVRMQGIQKSRIVGGKPQAGTIVFLVGELLDASDLNVPFVRSYRYLIKKVADDLVTVGRDADRLSFRRERADHPGARIGLARSGRSLHRKDAAIEVKGDADCRRQRRLTVQLQFLLSKPRSNGHQQVPGRTMFALAFHPVIRNVLTNPHQ